MRRCLVVIASLCLASCSKPTDTHLGVWERPTRPGEPFKALNVLVLQDDGKMMARGKDGLYGVWDYTIDYSVQPIRMTIIPQDAAQIDAIVRFPSENEMHFTASRFSLDGQAGRDYAVYVRSTNEQRVYDELQKQIEMDAP